jgi:predicted transcriptional regulator of viral defense system
MPRKTFSLLWSDLLAEGVVTVTTAQVAERARVSLNAARVALHDAQKAGTLFSPARSLYVLVPPQYRSWGGVPADWYVDDLMRHLGRAYYLSLLTGAARLGASHQATQLFQVVVDAKTLDREAGGVPLRFYVSRDAALRATRRVTGPTGLLTVATPETCLLDLAERPSDAGGIPLILEVVPELAIDVDLLVEAARERARAVVRRAGWILSRMQPHLDLAPLREVARPQVRNPTPLHTSGVRRGRLDGAWGVLVNVDEEGT